LNGEINETISAKVENGYIVFETSHLSQYGVIAKDKMVIENPKTGDNVMVNFATAILSIIGLSGMSIFIYKNKQTN
jgi:LPXTG-motif cell wall-anchored protein